MRLPLYGGQEIGSQVFRDQAAALEIYLEGLGFRSIGRILKISHTSVYYWLKKWGEEAELPVRDGPVEIVELGEMQSYVGQKKTAAGYGLLLIDLKKVRRFCL